MNVPFPHLGSLGRILLMDDAHFLLRAVARVLRSAGYGVDVAMNGDEAVARHAEALVAGAPYDLLILDLNVRNGAGGDLALSRIRERQPGVRALVSGPFRAHPVMADPARHGFHGALLKPYGTERLLETVGDAMAA